MWVVYGSRSGLDWMTRQGMWLYRRYRALALGAVSGSITSLSGILGYIVIPLLTGDYPHILAAAVSGGLNVLYHPLWYHIAVLVLPAFLTMVAATLLLSWQERPTTKDTLMLFGGAIGTPLLAVFLAYIVTGIGYGVSIGLAVIEYSVLYGILGAIFFSFVALLFGVIAVLFAIPLVFVGVGLGSTTGYLLARVIFRATTQQ